MNYTEVTTGLAPALAGVDVLYLSNNKPFGDEATREAVLKGLARGADGFGALEGEAGFDVAKHAAACLQIAGHIDFATLISC